MASSSKLHIDDDTDSSISDNESLDITVERKIAGGFNFTQEDDFLNLLCDNEKLAASCVNTIGKDGNRVGSPEKEATEMDMPDSDEEGIGVDFAVHNPMMKWSLMKPTEKEIYESPEQLRFALTNYAVANGYPLRFTRCDKKRIQVKCGKGEDGKTCPFVLWPRGWDANDLSK